MKVLFITNNYPPIVDGIGDHTYYMALQFANHGHKVGVICKKNIVGPVDGKLDGIQLLPIISEWNFAGIRKVISFIKKFRPDLVLLQYVPYGYNFYGVPFSIALLAISLRNIVKVPLAVFFHEYASGIGFEGQYRYLPVSIAQFFIAWVLKRNAKLSIYTLDVLDEEFAHVNNKLKLCISSNIPEDEDAKAIHKIKEDIAPNGEVVICTFGMKDQPGLLKVIKILKNKGLNFKLLVIGKLPQKYIAVVKTEAKSFDVEESICLMGFLNAKAVYHHLKASDIYIALDKVDRKGRGGISTKSGAIAAAFMASLPVIGTKGHMTGAIFQDKENILLVPHDDIELIVEKILLLTHNIELRSLLGSNARITYYRHMSWEHNYKRLINKIVSI